MQPDWLGIITFKIKADVVERRIKITNVVKTWINKSKSERE